MTLATISRHLLAALAAAVVAACAPAPDKPAAVTPQITEQVLRERAKEQLAAGVKHYEAGELEAAQKSFVAALDHGLLAKADLSLARKHLAFIHCVAGREQPCRDEFRKAFEINPDFSLAPAEDGHPAWGNVYRSVRTQLIAEREAAAAASKPRIPLARAEQSLADAMVRYDAGDYDGALKLYETALKESLKEKADQVKALKFTAFSLCLKDKYRECRVAFAKIYEVDAEFDLAPAEAGHPSWTKTFATAKAAAKKAIADKEAKEAREKAAAQKQAPAKKP